MFYAVKVISETDEVAVIRGRAFTFGGADLYGETFSKETDLWSDRLSQNMPLLYSHGRDETIGKEVLGRVVSTDTDDEAVWADSEIDKSKKYASAVLKLVREGRLGYSSGAISHLVEVAKGGAIRSWPWVELSLTTEPAEPRNLGIVELKELDIIIPTDTGVTVTWGDQPTTKALDYYEAITYAVADQLNAALNVDPFSPTKWASIQRTYADHVIVSVWDDGDTAYWNVPYSIDDSGVVTLGVPASVELDFVPTSQSGMASVAAGWTTIAHHTAEQTARTKDALSRRVKEGRTLSATNRAAIQRWLDGMAGMDDLRKEMTDLLTATEPQPAKAASVEQLAFEQQLALLALYVEDAA